MPNTKSTKRGSKKIILPIPVGAKVKFLNEKQCYTVQASDSRFAICNKPMNALKTVLYTIIDFKENRRGPENLIFGFGAETKEQCEEMLERLNDKDDPSEVSKRHELTPLDIERVDLYLP